MIPYDLNNISCCSAWLKFWRGFETCTIVAWIRLIFFFFFFVVDGGWSSWGPYSKCSRTCGSGGRQTRRRTCSHPAPYHGRPACRGYSHQTRRCGSRVPCEKSETFVNLLYYLCKCQIAFDSDCYIIKIAVKNKLTSVKHNFPWIKNIRKDVRKYVFLLSRYFFGRILPFFE